MIEGLLTAAAPLTLAGLGAILSDFSGALGIFIEGFMVLGAFFSWIFAGLFGSAALGSLLCALLAALCGGALARFVRLTGANPFIAGLALNAAAGGLTESLSRAWFGAGGTLRNPAVPAAAPLRIPLLEDVPFLGDLLSGQSPFAYLAWALTALTAFVMGNTVTGLRLRAAGLSPEAAAERGLAPDRYREGAWAAAAFLAALGGAAVTFRVGAYSPGGIAGRGWIALAAVYLGSSGRNPSAAGRVWGCALAALLFSLAERALFNIQRFGALPPTALLGLPSFLALILYALSRAGGKNSSSL